MTSAPSSEGASTPEESYAETTPLGLRGDVDETPVKPAPKRARKGKAEGQWALGYREPLNKNEQSKKDDNPLNVRARIENIYAHRGFDSIDPADLRGRFRWMGLYTQRAEGFPGTDTGHVEEEELDARHFMLRVRVDGGALTTEQLRVIGEICQTFARDTADITDRENIQLHWIRVEDVPEIWRRLEAVDLSTTEACGDCPRVVLGSPVAGIAADEVIDGTPAIAEIVDRFIGDRSLSNLPRKFKTAISGLQDVAHEVNDVAFVGVVHPEHGPGFDIHVGGGLSTNPKLAVRLGAWVPLDEVADVWHARGRRSSATTATAGCAPGPASSSSSPTGAPSGSARCWRTSTCTARSSTGPRPRRSRAPSTTSACTTRSTAASYVGVAPAGGPDQRLHARRGGQGRRGRRLRPGAAHAVPEAAGARRRRRTKVETLTTALDHLGLPARPSVFRRATMACTGLEFCKLAFVDTKNRAGDLVGELEKRLRRRRRRPRRPDLDPPQRLPQLLRAGAGRRHRAQGPDRQRRRGQPGGRLPGPPRRRARARLRASGASCAATRCSPPTSATYVEQLVRAFVEGRESEGERFAQWVVRAEEGAADSEVGRPVLPLLRRAGPAPRERAPRTPGSAPTAGQHLRRHRSELA